MLVSGKVFTIKEWMRDGLQKNEYLLVTSLVLGFSSIVIGILMLAGVILKPTVLTLAGWSALIIAGVIFADYVAKNLK